MALFLFGASLGAPVPNQTSTFQMNSALQLVNIHKRMQKVAHMNTGWIAIAVTVFASTGSDGTPNVNVVPLTTYDNREDCEKWRKNRYESNLGVVDPVTNRPVLAYYFECSPI